MKRQREGGGQGELAPGAAPAMAPGKRTRTQSLPQKVVDRTDSAPASQASPVTDPRSRDDAGDPFALHLLAPPVTSSPAAPAAMGTPPQPTSDGSAAETSESYVAAEAQIRTLLEQRIGAHDVRRLQARKAALLRIFGAIPTVERELLLRRVSDPADDLGRLLQGELSPGLRQELLAALRGAPVAVGDFADEEMAAFTASLGRGRFGTSETELSVHPSWRASRSIEVFARPGAPSPLGHDDLMVHWSLTNRTGMVLQMGAERWASGTPGCAPWTVEVTEPGRWEVGIEVVSNGLVIASSSLPILVRVAGDSGQDLTKAIGDTDVRAAAESMSNAELVAQTDAVRQQLGAYAPGQKSTDDERQVSALRDALRELEWEGSQRSVDGKSVAAPTDAGDLTLQDSQADQGATPKERALIQQRIDALIARRGLTGAEATIKDLEAELGADEALIHGGTTSSPKAMPWLHEEISNRRQEAASFLERFDECGRAIAYGLLAESEARVRGELQRYQLNEVQAGGGYSGQGLVSGGDPAQLRDAIAHGKQIQAAHAAWTDADRARTRDGAGDRRADLARTTFEATRAAAIAKHPLLRPFLEGTTQQARVMPSGSVPGVLDVGKYPPEQLNQKLTDIDQTRSSIGEGELSVFGVPKLVAITRQQMRVAPGTMLDGVVSERTASSDSTQGWTQGLIAAISLGLALLLAIPTNGASLTAAGVVTAGEVTLLASDLYLLGKDFEERGVYRAAANTDTSSVDSMLQEEPSAGPLIFGFLGFAGPVAGVGSVVRSGTDVAAAMARAREGIAAVRALRATAGAAAGELSRPDVVQRIEALRDLGREAGMTDDQIDALVRTVARGLARAPAAVGAATGALESAAQVTDDVMPELARQLGVSRLIRGGTGGEVGVRPTMVDGRLVVEEIVVGPEARVADVLAHGPTIERIGRYNGILGQVRSTWDEIRGLVGTAQRAGRNPHAPFTRAHEAFEEVRKYEGIIQSHIEELSGQLARGGGNGMAAAALLEDEIRLMEGELAHWHGVLDEVRLTGNSGVARGVIGSRDISAVTDEAIAAGYPRPPGDEYFYRRWPGGGPDGQEFQLLRRGADEAEAVRLQPRRGPSGWALEDVADAKARAELDRIRNGPAGRIRGSGELSSDDVASSLNAQLQRVETNDVDRLLAGFPAAEREQARVVLARSSGYGNLESMNSLRVAIEREAPGRALYLPGSGSLADNLAYAASKDAFANVRGAGGQLAVSRDVLPRSVVILDDVVLHRVQTDPAFARSLVDNSCVLLEPHGFVSGLNMYNSGSNARIAERTEKLLFRARELSAGGGVSFPDAVDLALREPTHDALAAASPDLAAQVKLVHAADHNDVTSAAIGRQLSGDGGISGPEIDTALAGVGLSDEQKNMARELLARQGEVFSPRRFANDLATQHTEVMAQGAQRGVSPGDVYFYIPEQGRSFGMIAMAHREATGTSVARYINGPADLGSRALGPETLIVIFDDVAGTGETLARAVKKAENTSFRGQILVSPMISTQEAREVFMNPTFGLAARNAKVDYAPRKMSEALTESAFYKGLAPDQQDALLRLVDDRGFGMNALSMSFPYMAPDNNSSLFGDVFAKFFIMNKNRAAAKSPTYKAPKP